jgi:drug/metabolite transporter (DMT)-like permease
MAICGDVIAPVLLFTALTKTTASYTAILNNGELLFTVLFASLIFGEKIRTPLGITGILMVLVGITMTAYAGIGNVSFNSGNMIVLIAAPFYALDNNIGKVVATQINSLKVIQVKYFFGGIVLLAITFLFKIPLNVTLNQLPYIAYLGSCAFAISAASYLYSMTKIGVTRSTMIVSTATPIALIFATIFLDENVDLFTLSIAAGIIMIGIYLSIIKNDNGSQGQRKLHG